MAPWAICEFATQPGCLLGATQVSGSGCIRASPVQMIGVWAAASYLGSGLVFLGRHLAAWPLQIARISLPRY
jgi:hypothetical protein